MTALFLIILCQYGVSHYPDLVGIMDMVLASHYPDLVGIMDVIADAKNIKKLLKLPFR